ncbi:large-conductance mechanosensitive channel protein MscL [Kineosporia mesophila]|uniref:Large-conductance mechanosensitive channel n=1 Tax=Kineosporia mesophila TaxID=566012 RepID=A0ABP7AEL8_9ACTN
MIKGFKEFIMRGNVMELAIAVVIGTAFSAVVTSVTKGVVQPLIASVGSANVGGMNFEIRPKVPDNATLVDLNGVLTSLLNFLIVAAVVYFLVVVPMNALMERRRRGEEPEPATPAEDILLLQEIRDLLRDRPMQQGPQG